MSESGLHFLRKSWLQQSFGFRLDHCMNEQWIDAAELAEKSGISESSIKSYISGETIPNLRNAYILALSLDVSLDYLCGIEQEGSAVKDLNDILKEEIERKPDKPPWR